MSDPVNSPFRHVTIYGTQTCNYCKLAKDLCFEHRVYYTYINIMEYPPAKEFIVQKEGHQTVPQIYENGRHIGGYTELRKELTE